MNSSSSLQDKAYNFIKESIINGSLKPLNRYSETKLAKQLHISRTPMREAIRCLSQEGYIQVLPSSGFMVRTLSEKDIKETIQVRCAIEGYCLHIIAVEHKTKKAQDLIAELASILVKMEAIAHDPKQKESIDSFVELDHQFHRRIIQFAENEEFNNTFQRLMYLIRLTSIEALSVRGRLAETLAEHKSVFEYLKEGNEKGAYNNLLTHLETPIKIHEEKAKSLDN